MTLEEKQKNVIMYRRLMKIAQEARSIAEETGTKIRIDAALSPNYGEEKPVWSQIVTSDGYRMDHFCDGYEQIKYEGCNIAPQQLAIGRVAPGFEGLMMKKTKK